MKARDIPNFLTSIRILLVIPLVVLLLRERFGLAMLLMVLAGLTDWFDGYLARRHNWQTRLGSILDPLADKLLVVTTVLALGWLGLVPLWLVVAVLVRDLVIVMGGVAYHMLVGHVAVEPTWISKINTAVQIALCVVIVFAQAVAFVPEWVSAGLIYLALVTTLLSGADYVIVWGRSAMRTGFKLHTHD